MQAQVQDAHRLCRYPIPLSEETLVNFSECMSVKEPKQELSFRTETTIIRTDLTLQGLTGITPDYPVLYCINGTVFQACREYFIIHSEDTGLSLEIPEISAL